MAAGQIPIPVRTGKEKRKSDQGKLMARTVLFLFQLLATAIT
jgi:hypothetical protein